MDMFDMLLANSRNPFFLYQLLSKVLMIFSAGETQCPAYAESCYLADYLSQNLPNFCYERIEKSVIEWKPWLCKINLRNKWHHMESPIIWKEMLMKGSKPFYIGGASEFLDYCYSYYNFDSLFASEKFDELLSNVLQFKKKINAEKLLIKQLEDKSNVEEETTIKTHFVITITGAGHLLAMHLISQLLDHKVAEGEKSIHKVYLYDSTCSETFMKFVEKECYYVQTNYPGKVVKYVEKIGVALTNTDLMIVLDHEPFNDNLAMGDWLSLNRSKMKELALMINASASRKMYVIVANLGPACYNATVLRNRVNINKKNIAVATSDLGLEILPILAEIAQVPMRNIFCPPVWGFVGINHLVDVRTTVHKYNSFEPHNRYSKVKNSTLNIGQLTPEFRTMDYLMHFDASLWPKVAEMKKKYSRGITRINKAISVVQLVNLWLLNPKSDHVVCLGIHCNGAFGLHFNGLFSQPARFTNGTWIPATDYSKPLDSEMKLPYLVEMAKFVMSLKRTELPPIIPFYPCTCKTKTVKKKLILH